MERAPGFGFPTHLVTGGIPQSREEGGELATKRSSGVFFKDDLVQGACRGDLTGNQAQVRDVHSKSATKMIAKTYPRLVAHQSLRSSVDLYRPLELEFNNDRTSRVNSIQDGKPSIRQYQRFLETYVNSRFPQSQVKRTYRNPEDGPSRTPSSHRWKQVRETF